jgi:hypothetical protein
MKKYLEILTEKSHFLKKYYLLNLNELERFAQGNFENVEHFYNQREEIIDILIYLSQKQTHLENSKIQTESLKNQECLTLKAKIEKLSHDILRQDMDVLSLVEGAKSSIIKELQKLKNGKKVLSSYKSPQTQSRRTHGRESHSESK